MPRYKISQTLLQSWNYVFDCWEGGEDAAMESFITALKGEKEDLSPEQMQNIQNGWDFEASVYDCANGNPYTGNPKWERGALELASIVRGAQFQVRIHKPITVNGMDFEIHGVLDALREGTIFDIKFKNKSFGSLDLAGNYLGSPQHSFYFYLVPEATKFMYLVSDGNDIYIEQYLPEDTTHAEDLIAEFMAFLESSNLMDLYKENWQIE